jgi:hypothetical protein
MIRIHTAARLLFVTGAALTLGGCSCRDDNVHPKDDTGAGEEDNADRGQWLSMSALSDGRPVISYYDRTSGALAVSTGTISDDEVSWAHEQVDGYTDENGLDVGDRGHYTSLAVGSSDSLWVAYQDISNGSLRYAVREAGGAWSTGLADGGDGLSPEAGLYASLALDPSGNPVIAHYESSAAELRVARWTGSAFTTEIVDEGEAFEPDTGASADADVGRYARIHIDTDGTERILYYDAANGALKLATGTTGSYTITTVDDDGDVGAWPSLLLESGTLHIAYHDLGNQDLKYATGDGTTFTVTTVADGEYVGADAEIFRDSSGALNVLYFVGATNDLYLATETDSTWSSELIDGDEAALGFHNETVEIDGTRYAACYDYTHRTIWFSSL